MSTDTRLPETTEQDLLDFLEIIKATPLRTMREIAADRSHVSARQVDTVEFPAVKRGPRHLAPYRGPKFWRHPVSWFTWNYDWLIYWGLNEPNRHRSHRMV